MLHVVHWPVSGITSLLRNLIPLMTSKGVRSHVIFFYHDADTIADFERICQTAHCLHLTRTYPRGVWQYFRLIRSIMPDVLHSHSFQPLVWASLLKQGQVKHVTTVHSNYPYFTAKTVKDYAKKTIEKFILKQRGTHTIAVGKDVHALLAGLGIPTRNLSLIENGVDVTGHGLDARARAEIRRELAIEGDQFVFVTLGRLDNATKGYDILLRAFRQTCQQHQNAILLLIGDGPDKEKLVNQAVSLGISKQVKFIGFRKNPANYLSAGDAYVCSSVIEGFGLAVAEALLCGLPVIATRVGAIPEMVEHGTSGLLVEPNDVAAIVAAFDDFICRRYPLAEMGRLGKQRVAEKYDVQNTAALYVKLYKSVMESGQ